mgnify:CR=1 FL=1
MEDDMNLTEIFNQQDFYNKLSTQDKTNLDQLKMVDEERCAQCYGTPFSFPLPSFAILRIMIFRKCSIKLGFYLT